MRLRNYITFCMLFTSTFGFSQTTFKNIDSLLLMVFETVNLNDSSKYIQVVNEPALFSEKRMYTPKDSSVILKPFYESYADFRESISDMAGSNDFSVKYLEFSNPLKKQLNESFHGKLLLHVKLVINETFAVTVPFKLTARNGIYSSEDPLAAMFLEN